MRPWKWPKIATFIAFHASTERFESCWSAVFGSLWLEAEISNLAKPSSGHWYFSLKDAAAQVRCCIFRQRNMLCTFAARDGQKVLVRARIGLYEPRGEYQLVIDHMEDAG